LGKTFGVISTLLGFVGLVMLILHLFVFIIPFGLFVIWAFAVVAIVFGIIGMIKDDSKGFGVLGLILGILTIVLWILAPIIFLGMLISMLP